MLPQMHMCNPSPLTGLATDAGGKGFLLPTVLWGDRGPGDMPPGPLGREGAQALGYWLPGKLCSRLFGLEVGRWTPR